MPNERTYHFEILLPETTADAFIIKMSALGIDCVTFIPTGSDPHSARFISCVCYPHDHHQSLVGAELEMRL